MIDKLFVNVWLFILAVGSWMDAKAGTCDPCSWLFHAVNGIPATLLTDDPHTAGLIFLYREGEQVFFRLKGGTPLKPLDHVMDVVVPWVINAGLWWLRHKLRGG
jgi:hypothetical protein